MSGGIYGGDDVGAIIFDAGSHSFRAGYGGEEYPKVGPQCLFKAGTAFQHTCVFQFDIPACVGVREVGESRSTDETIEEVASGKKGQTKNKDDYFIGTTTMQVPRAKTEVVPYMKEGMVEDWDLFERVLDHLYADCLRARSQDHSVLCTEAAVPAYFTMKNPVLAAFAGGRTAGLVLDSGATCTSAVPVFDGYIIPHAIVRSPIGGDFIVNQCRLMLEREGIDVVPYYKIASKKDVREGDPSSWKERTNLPEVTKSYEEFMKKQVIEDFAQSTLQLCDTPIDVDFMEKLPASSYCFPCGFHKDFLAERAKIPEAFFDLKYAEGVDGAAKGAFMTVAQVAATACGMSDVDMRSSLYANLMVTGGNSLIMGFIERLNHDLAHRGSATMKLRVTGANMPMERRFGAWIGGSIVSSLGTFQQLWISKGEYEESGKAIVGKKCA